MEKRKVKYKGRPNMYTVDAFNALPVRCKELYFELLEKDATSDTNYAAQLCMVTGMDFSWCESPIEIIFYFAFELMVLVRQKEFDFCMRPEEQYEIHCGDKKYIADFFIDVDHFEDKNYDYDGDRMILVECDGHDYHEKTKEQVKKRNERDMDLRMAGYDVIHFSGSQIYNEPYKCASRVIDYVIKAQKPSKKIA